MKIRSIMTRQTWLLAHRFVGLVMAFFLAVAGLTGCILAFYEELDTAVNAGMMLVTPPSADARPLDPLVLREQLQARYPYARLHGVSLAHKPGQSWTVRWRGGNYQVTFDLHRAGGLWPWAMLFVLAWSSVGFNLPQVFNPVMDVFFTKQQRGQDIPARAEPQPEPGIPWAQALNIGHGLMEGEARRTGFEILEPTALWYNAKNGVYAYVVRSDRDIAADRGRTWVEFDANTGEQRSLFLPTGQASGNTVRSWLFALHMATVGGLPYKIFMCIMGGLVAMVSITGVVIWWKKRTARRLMTQRQLEPSGILPSPHATGLRRDWEPETTAK